MSPQVNVMNATSEAYTIKYIARCRVVTGSIPLGDVAMLNHGFSERALMDMDVADQIGAVLVIGEPEDLAVLRSMHLPVSEKRYHDHGDAKRAGLPGHVLDWLLNGHRGLSSNAMCKRFFGAPADAGTSHPRDGSDFKRCLDFLDATQSHHKVGMMSCVSPEWELLVKRWADIKQLFDEEAPTGSTPKTNELIESLCILAEVSR